MINIWSVLNEIKLLIEKSSDDSTKKKDCLSWLVYIEVGLIVSSIYVMIKPIIATLNIMISNVIYVVQNQLYADKLYIPYVLPDIHMEFKFLIIGIVPAFVVLLLMQFNIKRIFILFVCVMIQFLLFVFYFREARYFFILLMVIGVLVSLFFPIGSGFYFDLIKYANYLPDIYEYKECTKKEWKRIVLIITLCCLGFVFSIQKLFPIFSKKLLVLVFISIAILLWINNSEGKTRSSLKKIFVYAFFIPFVLLNNNVFELSLHSVVLAIISIFFAIDRLINLFKELIERIKNESLRFLIDEIPSEDYLIKERIIIEKEMHEYISEKTLIRQIVIHYMLNLRESETLIHIYKEKDYKRESMLIGAIDYFLNITQECTLEEKREKLDFICEKRDKDICYIPILEEYARVLYCLDSNYPKIVDILKDVWLFIRDDSKYILYYAYLQTEDIESAEVIKSEIGNFREIENNLKRNEEK